MEKNDIKVLFDDFIDYIENKERGYATRAKVNALVHFRNNKAATKDDVEKIKTPYFSSEEKLNQERPNASEGSKAWVGAEYPGTVWVVKKGKWEDTGKVPPAEEVNLAEYAKNGGSDKTLQEVDDSVIELELIIKRDIFGNVNIIDRNGYIGLQLTSNGKLRVSKFELNGIDVNSFIDTINATIINTSKGITTFEDSKGYIAMRINLDGSIDIGKLNVKELNALNIKQATPHIWGNAPDYIIIESFGQSNAIGNSALPILSTTQKYDSLMLPYLVNSSGSSLVPLTEVKSASYLGETNLSGFAEAIIETIQKKRFLNSQNKGFQIVANCIGAGGQPISTFLKGTDVYNKGITSITDIKNIADKTNKNVSVAAVAWIQSESNMFPQPITIEQYETDLLQLFADKNTDYKAITGQKNDILFFGYQTAWGNWNVPSAGLNIPLLFYKLHKKLNNFFLAAAWYPFTYMSESDQYIHIDATSQKRFGQYLGRAYKRLLIDNNTTVVTEPVAFSISSDNILRIKCKAPCLPLVIDITNMPKATESYGFKVFDASNNKLTISESDISVDYETIIIKCPAKPSRVSYAVGGNPYQIDTNNRISGNRGNIRDSQGENDTWNGKRMDNWLLMFEQNL